MLEHINFAYKKDLVRQSVSWRKRATSQQQMRKIKDKNTAYSDCHLFVIQNIEVVHDIVQHFSIFVA